ncbi:MAG: dihydropteroate synthase [Bacteroidales bacterium]|nr:dihydropteroate synthase [Bacteroidales bacterium]
MILSFNGKKLDLSIPRVMGILNLSPDSFFDGGRFSSIDAQLKRVEQMLEEGASIIDLGAVSTRPGAKEIGETGELDHLVPSLKAIRRHFPDCFLSVDTYHSSVARKAVDLGADLINDIYGGRFEDHMLNTIARLGIPYILMHMKGTPDTMQQQPEYQDVVAEIAYFFQQQTEKLREHGASQVLIDPGFGFGKTVGHNFEILYRLQEFESLGFPLVVGVSRKSMIQKTLGVNALESLNGSTVLHTIALLKGASILRVHDVKEAVQAVKLVKAYKG